MTTLTGKNENDEFASRLKSFKVDVLLPDSAKTIENFKNSCYVALNLLPRLVHTVRYIGSEEILSMFPSSHKSKINLKDDSNPSITLVFGNEKISSEKNPIYVGASGWSVYLSRNQPCNWEPIVENGLSALYSGTLAVGEVFKNIMTEIKSDKIDHFEYDLLTHGAAPQPVINPAIPYITNFNDLTIVGCGAVGQALCYALKFATRISGRIRLIDHDKFEPSNEQRYLGAFVENRQHEKAAVMTNFLSHYNPNLLLITVPMKYEDYTHGLSDISLDEVVVAVDNVWTRLNVQAGLPRVILNGWTDVSVNNLRYGVGRHSISDGAECLACSYYPEGSSPTDLDLISQLTGFSKDEIKQKMEQRAICTRADIERISKSKGIQLEYLLPNENKPFLELLHGNCGVFRRRAQDADVVAPAPHVPVLTGILLATQLILGRLSLPDGTKLIESKADFDAFSVPNPYCLIKTQKISKCFCSDSDYINAYNSKWSNDSSSENLEKAE